MRWEVALPVVVVLVVVVASSLLATRLSASPPLLLVAVGIVSSYLPFVPEVELTPELVLIGLLPPLLYSAAIRTSLIDFHANRRPILPLSVGLVVFTAFGVALLVWWLLPVPFAVALALGAVVAPLDAVAATTIARRVGLPRRLVTIRPDQRRPYIPAEEIHASGVLAVVVSRWGDRPGRIRYRDVRHGPDDSTRTR